MFFVASHIQEYLSVLTCLINKEKGLISFNAFFPFSQNELRITGLNPDIMLTLFIYDTHGKPFVLRKFQYIICGGE